MVSLLARSSGGAHFSFALAKVEEPTLNAMLFSDIATSRRLERAEGFACAQHAEALRSLNPGSGAEWMQCGGAIAVFNGVDSPVTQSFGLGIFEDVSAEILDKIEDFFKAHGAPVFHEVSPLAGAEAFALLCARGYRPVELSNVVYQEVKEPAAIDKSNIAVRVAGASETKLWSEISARGWSRDHPEFAGMMLELGEVTAARGHTFCFIAEFDGIPGAAGALCLHEGVALLAGAATVPELRRRGLQSALLRERMRYAFEHGCDLAMMAALPGSDSQRNAERAGFRIAYTRTKWQLHQGIVCGASDYPLLRFSK
jgi:GNAT superfamily N-acetyltransferase